MNTLTEKIETVTNNFYEIYQNWIEGEYEISRHLDTHKLKLNFNDYNLQPLNTNLIINNQSLHRLYIPTTEAIISYDVIINDNINDKIIYYGDYDLYITPKDSNLIESVTGTNLKQNLVYIIPAGQYYQLVSSVLCEYHMILKKRIRFKENPSPTNLEILQNLN